MRDGKERKRKGACGIGEERILLEKMPFLRKGDPSGAQEPWMEQKRENKKTRRCTKMYISLVRQKGLEPPTY